MKMFLVETLLNLVIYVRNVQSKNTETLFPIYYIYYCPERYTDTEGQHCFSKVCLFVLISHHFKPFNEIRTNEEQTVAEKAKKLRTMSIGKIN